MAAFQVWLVAVLAGARPIATMMHTHWAWPVAESVHFIGLSLLVGTIFLFDLRLIGLNGRQVPGGAGQTLVDSFCDGFDVSGEAHRSDP